MSGHGDQNVVAKLHPYFKQGLPRESVEWRRSFGRPARKIKVDCKFFPFKESHIPKDDNWTLLGRPFFHMFFTECDLDAYKASVREEIAQWIGVLKSNNIQDWLVVVVVNDESKVKSKILRTSIIDKVKNDFCAKSPDRCTVLQEPFRPDSKSSDGWNKLFSLMRQLILQSFNTTLNRFEDHMREQREKRQEGGWSFNSYFLLQEELAFMFEMLGLFEDALVQYDELDALFTQFVLNHAAGDTADWLTMYTDHPPQRWTSITLSQPIDTDRRSKIRENNASLLDFRNYLFLRQSTLLFLLLRPWEVSQRAIPFMHNCLKELSMLELELQPGAAACWVFLTCLEILKTCESFTSSGQMDPYSLHMAVLWDFARQKMCDLGALCGLMPDMSLESQHLGTVVELIAGFTQTEDTEPMIKLREALSSKKAFTKHYLELSELAMGAYKHIGRMRSAKLISKDLADFYMKCDEPQKAESFLLDALKIYVQENWRALADDTRLKLAVCQQKLGSYDKYCRTCVHLAASQVLDAEKRKHFQREVISVADKFTETPICIPTRPLLLITEIEPAGTSFSVCEDACLKVVLHLGALEPLHCDAVTIALAFRGDAATSASTPDTPDYVKQHRRTTSSTSFCSVASGGSIDLPLSLHQPHSYHPSAHPLHPSARTYPAIHLTQHNEYTANKKRLAAVSLKSRVNLRRLESGSKVVLEKEVERGDYTVKMSAENVRLEPGENVLHVKSTLAEPGQYLATQVCLTVKGLQFLRNIPIEEVSFQVVKTEAKVELESDASLCVGVNQTITLILNAGAQPIPGDTKLQVLPSTGLQISSLHYEDGYLSIPTSHESSQVFKFALTVLCDVSTGDSDFIQQQIAIRCEELGLACEKTVTFQQPLRAKHNHHTCGIRKFVQFYVQSDVALDFEVSKPCLSCDHSDVELISLNRPTSTMVVNEGQSVSYMWELKCNLPDSAPSLECAFTVQYRPPGQADSGASQCKTYHTAVHIRDYKTLYKVKTDIEKPEDVKVFKEGEEYTLLVRARKLNRECSETVLYNLHWDHSTYSILGKVVGVLETEEEGLFSQRLRLRPVKAGLHALPQLQLFRCRSNLDKDEVSTLLAQQEHPSQPLTLQQLQDMVSLNAETSGTALNHVGGDNRGGQQGDNSGECGTMVREFSVGQVYNTSLAQTVEVMRSENTGQRIIQHPLLQELEVS